MSSENSIDKTLEQRKAEYGDWAEDGGLADVLIGAVEVTPRWKNMPGFMRQSIRLILVKVARLCCGNPHNVDSWHDIQGYARLDAIGLEPKIPGYSTCNECGWQYRSSPQGVEHKCQCGGMMIRND
jgi:hypothetical protein